MIMGDLSKYISIAFDKGYTKEEVVETFLDKGYSMKEINDALNPIGKGYKKPDQGFKTIGYPEKLKLLFSKPIEFFNVVREPKITKSMVSFLIVSASVLLISFAISFITMIISYGAVGNLGFMLSSSFLIILLILIFASTFIFSGIYYLVVKLFKGTGTYTDTYNAYTYSLIPGIILSVIPIVGYLFFIYSIVLMVFGFSRYHNISKGKAVLVVLIPIIPVIILIVVFVLFLFFSLRGISM